jgi:hypothetical protein
MASPPRNRGREDERRLSIRTLVIASAASATAAVITSQFWASGTPIAAAVTPVLVSLVSEMLHRPTEKIAERLTVDAPVGRARQPAMRRGGHQGREVPPVPTDRTPVEPPPVDTGPVPVNVYRQPGGGKRRRIAVGVVVTTAALAFAIAAVALTVPELIAGQSIGKSDRKSTYFGGHHRKKSEEQPQDQQTTPTETQTQSTQTTPEDKNKESTTPSEDKQKTTTQKTTTQKTTPQSQPGK